LEKTKSYEIEKEKRIKIKTLFPFARTAAYYLKGKSIFKYNEKKIIKERWSPIHPARKEQSK